MGNEEGESQWCLIGSAITALAQVDAYALFLTNEDEPDRPLTCRGRIAFFGDPKLAKGVLALTATNAQVAEPVPCMVCDLPGALDLIHVGTYDDGAVLLNVINTSLDLLRGAALSMPTQVKSVLYPLADFLTFSREVGEYFTNEATRRAALDALLCCIGAITAHAVWLDTESISTSRCTTLD